MHLHSAQLVGILPLLGLPSGVSAGGPPLTFFLRWNAGVVSDADAEVKKKAPAAVGRSGSLLRGPASVVLRRGRLTGGVGAGAASSSQVSTSDSPSPSRRREEEDSLEEEIWGGGGGGTS